MEFLIFISFCILCGIVAAVVANRKGWKAGGWFLIGLLLGPMAGAGIGYCPTGENGIDRFDETDFDNDDKAASLAVSDHRPGPPFTLMLTMIKGGTKCFDVYV